MNYPIKNDVAQGKKRISGTRHQVLYKKACPVDKNA